MSQESLLPNKDLRNSFGFQNYLTPAVLLALILLLGLALRFHNLGAKGYWNDEMYTVIEAQQSVHQLITSGKLDQPPAYYLPVRIWVQTFGTTEVSMRSFSALAGMGAMILIYLIGRELFGKPVGLLSTFIMAISEFQIYYSQQARFYSFYEMMTLLSVLLFIIALRSKRIIYFALYGVASILMVYSHTFGVFIIAAQNLFLILQIKKYKNVMTTWLICQLLVLLAFVPNLYLLFFGGTSLGGTVAANAWGLSAPSILAPLRTASHFILTARGDRSWGMMLANYLPAGAMLLAGTWFYTIRRGKNNLIDTIRWSFANLQEVPDLRSKLLLVSCWFLCSILVPVIFSRMVVPIYLDRYVIGAAPALYLLLAFGVFSARKVVPIAISLAVLVIMVAPGLGKYYVTATDEQWKEAAKYVDANHEPNDVIVFAAINDDAIPQKAFERYYQSALQGCNLGLELIEPIAISGALMQCVSGHDRFWLIMPDHPSSPDILRYKSFFLNSNQSAIRLIKETQFVKVSVYLFELTK